MTLLDPTPLIGVADADNFRMTVDWGRFYIDPLPTCEIAEATEDRWPSCSTVKKAADKDWSFLTVNRLAALAPAEWRRIAELDATQRGDAIRSHEKLAKNIAFGRGTILHLWAEDLLAGRAPREITDEWLAANRYPAAALEEAKAYLPALLDFFQTYQPEPVAVEYVTIHRTLNGHGYGATPDAIVRIDGEVVGVDWKTRGAGSSHAAYAEEAAQIACGAFAEYMIAKEGDRAVRRRLPAITGGYVVSIRPDGARLYPIDIDKAFTHWTRLHEWWVHRLTEKAPIGRVLPARSAPKETPCTTTDAAPASTTSTRSPSAPTSSSTTSGTPTSETTATSSASSSGSATTSPTPSSTPTQPDRAEALRQRFFLLNDADRHEFRSLLLDPDDLDAIEAALNRIDAFASVSVAAVSPPEPAAVGSCPDCGGTGRKNQETRRAS